MAQNVNSRLFEIQARFEQDVNERGLFFLANRIQQSLTDGVDSVSYTHLTLPTKRIV